MSDEELDRDWKPNGRRPQSTIARSFSQELMDIFRIENSVADLDQQVDQRKKEINTQTSELEALEARIREMEKRLQSSNGTTHPGFAQTQQNPTASRSPRAPISGAFDRSNPPPPPEKDLRRPPTSASQQKTAGSRPGTARQSQQAVPGALPPTPTASEDGDRD
ncbi:hypothetical protein GQ53DRAFT_708787 [Thozetella sp. PMI_491]|nr:hypothetical protein GQ53DRAFT_708787 [Thozetella sp. PMI_491]